MDSRSKVVKIKAGDKFERELLVKVVPISSKVRLVSAFKSLMIFFIMAIGAVFIPILHFVLVPGFLIAGIFFALNSYWDDVKIEWSLLNCLSCQSSLVISDTKDQFPKWLKCTQCQAEHQIVEG